MKAYQLQDGLYYIGVLNPSLRVFDIVMATEYGTSYNSYLLKGKEKTALIETAHLSFFDYYLENLNEITSLDEIDYIIMNHNEPDHSGSLVKLLEMNPNITVIASKAGSTFLKNITNLPDLNIQIVADGDTLDLGGRVLTFRMAPFLHWPDTMFTYVEDMGVVFSCDFLGSHYCEPQALDTKVHDMDAYTFSMENYFNAIFSPFKPYVLDGLRIMDELDPLMVCTSHGPVLTKGGLLEEVEEAYRNWSTPAAKEQLEIPVFYCSAYGNTEALAEAVMQGISKVLPQAEVAGYDIIKYDMADLAQRMNEADAFLIGSPTLNRDAVPPVWQLLSHAEAVGMMKRPVAVFGSYGWSGEAVPNIEARLKGLKADVFEQNYRVLFVPSEEQLEKAEEFGRLFAEKLRDHV